MSSADRLQRSMLFVLVVLLAGIATLLIVGRQTRSRASGPPVGSQFSGAMMPPGLRASNFALTDQRGTPVVLSRDRGEVVVLTFIHSLCHDACPLMVEQIKGALNELPNAKRKVGVIGVSVAPGEDTPANRRRFLTQHQMSGRLQFVSGSAATLRRVWHAYAIRPGRAAGAHSAFILLIDKRGIERIGFAADQLTPEGLAHDIADLTREAA